MKGHFQYSMSINGEDILNTNNIDPLRFCFQGEEGGQFCRKQGKLRKETKKNVNEEPDENLM